MESSSHVQHTGQDPRSSDSNVNAEALRLTIVFVVDVVVHVDADVVVTGVDVVGFIVVDGIAVGIAIEDVVVVATVVVGTVEVNVVIVDDSIAAVVGVGVGVVGFAGTRVVDDAFSVGKLVEVD